MRGLLIGCGVILLIGVILAGYFGYRAVKAVRGIATAAAQIQSDLAATNQDFPFAPPADGLVDEERFGVWMEARRDLAAASDELLGRFEEGNNVWAMMGSMGDLFTKPGEAMVQALNSARMSVAEYQFIAGQVYGTLDNGDVRAMPEAEALVSAYDGFIERQSAAVQNNSEGLPDLSAPVTSAQAAHMIDLILAHEDAMLETITAYFAEAMALQMSAAITAPRAPAAASPTPAPASAPATAPAM